MTTRPIDPVGPPLPGRPIMNQWWRDLCFLHWRVDPSLVEPHLPRGTRPDTTDDGSAWVGLIPFRMVDAGLGGRRPVPYLGTFLELNVRTYAVDDEGRRGVVFCSLEAERAAVVAGARVVFGTAYMLARMDVTRSRLDDRERLTWRSRRSRVHGDARPTSRIVVDTGPVVDTPSDEDLFLTARFGLHTSVLGRTLWVPNSHDAWPLHRATLVDLDDELLAAAGFPGVAGRRPDSVLYSPGVRTVFGAPQRIRRPRPETRRRPVAARPTLGA